MSHAHSASFDSAFLPVSSRQAQTASQTQIPAHSTTLPLLQPMDLASYGTPTPLMSHTTLAAPFPLSDHRDYAAHPHPLPHPQPAPHTLSPPHAAAYPGHASMASIDSTHSVGSLGSVSSLASVFSGSGHADQPTYPAYSVAGTPYIHPTPLMHIGSIYDSPGQAPHAEFDGYSGASDGPEWVPFRLGRGLESIYPGTREYDSLGAAIELKMGLAGMRQVEMGMGRIHPADGLEMGLPEWRGYTYAQPEYADPRAWNELDEKLKSRRHVCAVCEKRFNRPSSLATHLAVHTGAKPYKCSKDECGRCFSVSSNLRRHMRTHDVRDIKKGPGESCSPTNKLPKLHPRPAAGHAKPESESPSPPKATTSPTSSFASPETSAAAPPELKPIISSPRDYKDKCKTSSSPLTSLAPLSFPRSMHTHTRSTPAISLGPIGPIVPYSHNYTHSFSSFAYDSATPSLGLGLAGNAAGSASSGLSAFGSGSGGVFGGISTSSAGSDTPLPSGMSVLSFGSGTTATGLDQYSLRRSSASVGAD